MGLAKNEDKKFKNTDGIAVLGEKTTVLGMKLAGIKKAYVAKEDKQALLEQFNEIASSEDVKLIIVDCSCSKIKNELLSFIETNRKPVIIEIPCWKDKTGSYIFNSAILKVSGIKQR
ncbi:MAG: V-type ATP synthase subunit F [Candidatus Diapherotrites archaeon]